MPSNPTDRDTLLARIREGGLRRRMRRRRAFAGAGVALVVVMLVPVLLLSRRDDRQDVVSTASSSRTTSTTTSTTALTSTTVTEVSSTDSSTTPTTALVCRNSDNPACGPMFWDPPINNQPLTGSMSSATAQPRAGQPVELTIVASDPDSTPVLCYADSITVDQPVFQLPTNCYLTQCGVGYTGYGPHDPPPPEGGGERTAKTALTFSQPGSYALTAHLFSRSGTCGSLYDSTTDTQLSIAVSP